MNFPNQDYLAMLKNKQVPYQMPPQNPQAPMLYPNPGFMYSPINYVPNLIMMQHYHQLQQLQQMNPIRMQMPPTPIPVSPLQPMPMTYPNQSTIPAQQKSDQTNPVQVKGTKVWLNLKIIREFPEEEDSCLDYDEIKRQNGDHEYINIKRKRRLLDQYEVPIMQTRRRSEQFQYMEIKEMLKVDDNDMSIILRNYSDLKTLLQELKNGNLKDEIHQLLLK